MDFPHGASFSGGADVSYFSVLCPPIAKPELQKKIMDNLEYGFFGFADTMHDLFHTDIIRVGYVHNTILPIDPENKKKEDNEKIIIMRNIFKRIIK